MHPTHLCIALLYGPVDVFMKPTPTYAGLTLQAVDVASCTASNTDVL